MGTFNMWGHLGPTLRLMNQISGVGSSVCSPKVPQVVLLCAPGPCLCKNDDVQDRVVSELGLDRVERWEIPQRQARNSLNSLRGGTGASQNSVYFKHRVILEVKTSGA